MLLKGVETSVWCICSPSDLCIGSDTGSGKVQPTLVNVETSVWCIGRPPVIYGGGWMLYGDESRMLHGQHIYKLVVEVMVKTFQRCIHIHCVGM